MKKDKKIIFLDIDGVLNSNKTGHYYHDKYGDNGFGGFFRSSPWSVGFGEVVENPTEEDIKWGQDLVDNLKRVVNETGAEIVISSTWRQTHLPPAFVKMFKTYFFDDAPVIGATPRIYEIPKGIFPERKMSQYSYPTRGYEIQYWLDNHPEVMTYCIIDDSSDFTERQKSFFVHTDYKVGFSSDDADKAIKILNNKIYAPKLKRRWRKI